VNVELARKLGPVYGANVIDVIAAELDHRPATRVISLFVVAFVSLTPSADTDLLVEPV
jgi:hypothetical protein